MVARSRIRSYTFVSSCHSPRLCFFVAPANRLPDLAACSGLEPDKGASLQAVYPFRGMMRFIRFSATVPFHPRADVGACPPTGEGNPAGGKEGGMVVECPSTLKHYHTFLVF